MVESTKLAARHRGGRIAFSINHQRMKQDPEREERITCEIVVDAYNEMERAMGWYCYLDDRLSFPFEARCSKKLRTSPLAPREKLTVVAMAPSEECEHEMFVTIEQEDGELDVPLAQSTPLDADEETRQAIADWHHWVGRGYGF